MKKTLIIKHLLFLLVLTFIVSCSKKSDEVTPASLVGKWKDNGTVGKLSGTDNGKAVSYDISSPASNIIIEFKNDGTALVDGDAINYKLTGSILTLSVGNLSYDYTVSKVSATELVLSLTKEQYYKFADLVYDTTSSDYKSIQNIKSNAVVEYKENYVKQ
jgi:hypothetical protein